MNLPPETPGLTSAAFFERPWGGYEVIARGEGYLVKRLVVSTGAALSLQRHSFRSEVWTIALGVAEVTVHKDTAIFGDGDTINIPLGAVHRLRNVGPFDLEVIEVQYGQILTEDDITRFEDDYGRS